MGTSMNSVASRPLNLSTKAWLCLAEPGPSPCLARVFFPAVVEGALASRGKKEKRGKNWKVRSPTASHHLIRTQSSFNFG